MSKTTLLESQTAMQDLLVKFQKNLHEQKINLDFTLEDFENHLIAQSIKYEKVEGEYFTTIYTVYGDNADDLNYSFSKSGIVHFNVSNIDGAEIYLVYDPKLKKIIGCSFDF